MSKTPEILWRALRQYRHNTDNSPSLESPEHGFVCGFDYDEVITVVEALQAENKALREENQDLRLHLITALVPDGYDTKTWESWLGKISQKNS